MESSGVSGITGIDVSDNQMSDDIAVIITPALKYLSLTNFISSRNRRLSSRALF